MELVGTVTSGFGRGADYIRMEAYQERFHNMLGFYPYPGTLNIEVDVSDRKKLVAEAGTAHIDSFEEAGEQLSAVTVHTITIDGVEAALLDLEITDHPNTVAEIIAPINLREKLGLEDGDTVICRPRT